MRPCRFDGGLNRTKLELKHEGQHKEVGYCRCLNRTKLELKLSLKVIDDMEATGLNRTKLELKLNSRYRIKLRLFGS